MRALRTHRLRTPRRLGVALAALAFFVAGRACKAQQDTTARTALINVTGAGATFPYPLYVRWFADYSAVSNTRINYFSVGTGEGIVRLRSDSVDFGATDVPLPDSVLLFHGQPRFAQVPMVIGGVAIAFNVPGVRRLNLDGETLAAVLLGRIRQWDDRRLTALNPGEALPPMPISVVHRDDVSGTTNVLSAYLHAISPTWQATQPVASKLTWPVGEGEHGNEGIGSRLKATIGSIGYVQFAYAQLYRLQTAHLRNAAGEFVAPSSAGISAAAETVLLTNPPPIDLRVPLVNATGSDAYPIATMTWLAFPLAPLDTVRGRAVRDFVRWALARGASQAVALDFAPIPARMAAHLDSVVAHLPLSVRARRP